MKAFDIPTHTFAKEVWAEATPIVEMLQKENIDLIVLAGFMRKIEAPLTAAYAGRIVNIHPSLLPRHGGPGMYGHHVHEAVLAAGDTESGITIHYVDEQIDGGEIIFQARCEVLPDDTPDTLANRIHVLEHRHFPEVVVNILSK
jgi:phosphoribosylglycinamide formyltransferase-1